MLLTVSADSCPLHSHMKLPFDENLSPKLPNRLSDFFPDSLHVREVGMKATINPVVWDYAKDNDLMIASKDADI